LPHCSTIENGKLKIENERKAKVQKEICGNP
jgi:hypothetical protein